MGFASTLLAVAVLAGPPVEVSTFSGSEHKGELVSLKGGQLVISQEGQEKTLALGDVLELRLDTKAEPNESDEPAVLLTDGSRFHAKSVATEGKKFTFDAAGFGKVELPAESVTSIRLAPPVNAVADSWTELTKRQDNTDLLVIRKPEANLLDFIGCIVGDISEENIQVTLAGQPRPVKRSERIYGVVYGNRKPPANSAVTRAVLPNQDSVNLKSLTWNGEAFEGELVAGAKITLPLDKISSLDFSLGKVQYLSDIKPRNYEYELPYFVENERIPKIEQEYHSYKINQNFSGKPLQLGNTVYARGLCIHTKTVLTYRLSKEMRRFQAMMGIDKLVAQRNLGDVKVTIEGDGKPLLETKVIASDEPRKIDLDVSGVVVLKITVDFAHEYDIGVGDHLDLADAKFIK